MLKNKVESMELRYLKNFFKEGFLFCFATMPIELVQLSSLLTMEIQCVFMYLRSIISLTEIADGIWYLWGGLKWGVPF